MSQQGKPVGLMGRLIARSMAWGHKDFYKNAAMALGLKPNDDFLEIGFGSGIFIKKYASHVRRISGLDHSADMVNMAASINKDLVQSGKAEFRQGDASSIPWADNEFTAAAGIEIFYFLNAPEAAGELYRVLKPEGRLLIEMAFNKDDGQNHSRDIKKMDIKMYSGKEMRDILLKAGFDDISIEYYKGFWIPFKGCMVKKVCL